MTLRGAGGHIGEQQVLSQSGRWREPPKMATSKTGEPLIGPRSILTGAEPTLLCQGPSLSAPGPQSHDRRCLRQTLCVAFVCGCFEVPDSGLFVLRPHGEWRPGSSSQESQWEWLCPSASHHGCGCFSADASFCFSANLILF